MALWFSDRVYDDELTAPSPECAHPVVLGDLATYGGTYWAVTGWDEAEHKVFIGLDCTIKEVDADEVGMCWEKPSPIHV